MVIPDAARGLRTNRNMEALLCCGRRKLLFASGNHLKITAGPEDEVIISELQP